MSAADSMFSNAGYAFAMLSAGALFAFWPQYLSRSPAAIDAHTHAHAAAMAAWCILLVAQPLLIRTGRRTLHRSVGKASYIIAPLVLVTSILLAHLRFRSMDDATFRTEAPSLYLPLSAVVLFAISYGGAIRHRRLPAVHARFMICAALTLIDPVLGRILFFYGPALPHPLLYQALTYGLTDLILVALILRERHAAAGRWVFPSMLSLFAAAHAAWFTLAQTAAWTPLAAWFRSLSLP